MYHISQGHWKPMRTQSPKQMEARCHPKMLKEFQQSHHPELLLGHPCLFCTDLLSELMFPSLLQNSDCSISSFAVGSQLVSQHFLLIEKATIFFTITLKLLKLDIKSQKYVCFLHVISMFVDKCKDILRWGRSQKQLYYLTDKRYWLLPTYLQLLWTIIAYLESSYHACFFFTASMSDSSLRVLKHFVSILKIGPFIIFHKEVKIK